MDDPDSLVESLVWELLSLLFLRLCFEFWKEFKKAPAGTSRLLTRMFILFVVGLAMIVYANA